VIFWLEVFKVQIPNIKSFPTIFLLCCINANFLHDKGVKSLTDMHPGYVLSRFFIFVLIILVRYC